MAASSTTWGCDFHLSSAVSASMAGPSSASVSSSCSYDVFLSFRGEDTRCSFAAHLYDALEKRGVNAFFDDNKIRRGESISPTLKKAIEGSRSSIVLLSKNYANSTWCLEELVKIIECKETMGQLVFPIFYSVDPSDVRKHKGSFGEALLEHEKNLKENKDKVKKWREALTEVANVAGWNSLNKSEPKFIEEIVINVSQQLSGLSLTDANRLGKANSRIPSPQTTSVQIGGTFDISGNGKKPFGNVKEKVFRQCAKVCSVIENVGEETEKIFSEILESSDDDDDDFDLEEITSKFKKSMNNFKIFDL